MSDMSLPVERGTVGWEVWVLILFTGHVIFLKIFVALLFLDSGLVG